jgi:hypothetical protein
MKTWKLFWSPEGRCVATVRAKDPHAAIRKVPYPWRKFKGEVYAEEVVTVPDQSGKGETK